MINAFKERDIAPILEIEQGLTVQTTLEASPIVMQIKAYGRAAISQALDLQLIRLAGMMNVKHNLSDAQIQTIVFDLIEKYPNETLEDFMLVFKRMRQGYYGESYHLLNEATILGCMEIHLEEKWTLHERNLKKQQEELNKPKVTFEVDKDGNEVRVTEAPDQFLGLKALTMALEKKGNLEQVLKKAKQLEDERSPKGSPEYQQFKDNYLRKQITKHGNQTQSTNQKPDRGGADQADSSNE